MIRVLVVDDDFRVADVHARFVGRLPGFEVVGVAHTAADAIELAKRQEPDLVLLDQYLPDGKGTSIAGQLGCDVIMLTAAADSSAVREALGRGVVNYLVKPFADADLADRLRAYARFHEQYGGDHTLEQADIDRAVRVLHEGDRGDGAVRKGRSSQTAQMVVDALRAAGGPVTVADLAAELGLSRATAQRYLSDLAADGRARVTLRYGTTGRPEHLYTWSTSVPGRPPRRP